MKGGTVRGGWDVMGLVEGAGDRERADTTGPAVRGDQPDLHHDAVEQPRDHRELRGRDQGVRPSEVSGCEA